MAIMLRLTVCFIYVAWTCIQLSRPALVIAELVTPTLIAHLVALVHSLCLSLLHSSIDSIGHFLRVKPLPTLPIEQETET